jgi:threonyl-tRNA synthetase
MKMDNEEYYIKPMNCPFHHLIFRARGRSYRELPLRLAEYGWCHRYEDSGALMGLMRVRGMQMNDAHIYCTKEQSIEEFLRVIKLHEQYYKTLGITEYWMELSLRDPKNDKYHKDEKMWEEAESLTRKAMELSGVKYKVVQGGAAFYGPKVDFQIKSAIGREFTVSTSQLDLYTPMKFNLKYAGQDGSEHMPVVIHRAPLGTHERFIGFLIEHFAGHFPLWLAPYQVIVLPISERHIDYANKVKQALEEKNVRVVTNYTPETVEAKVRDAQMQKIPVILIVGDKEIANNTVAVRRAKDNSVTYGVPLEKLVADVSEEILTKKLP